jgi:hypothetical protein
MAVCLQAEEAAEEKVISLDKLQRDADVAYNTVKWVFKDPYDIRTTEALGKLAGATGVLPVALLEEVSDEPRGGSASLLRQ